MLDKFRKEIVQVLLDTKSELAPLIEKLDMEKISKHNKGYLAYSNDPVKYFIDMEFIRYAKTLDFLFNKSKEQYIKHILDIGFFIPVIPICLAKLGFAVSSIEKLSYYDGALDKIIEYTIKHYRIELIDEDLFDFKPKEKRYYDSILLLAVIEHLHGSPRFILNTIKKLLKLEGYLVLDTPNISSLTKRIVFLVKGKPPNPHFKDYFYSEYPFSGHNREYTLDDVLFALNATGFNIVKIETFYHSLLKPKSIKAKLLYYLEKIGPQSWKPYIWTVAQPRI